MFVDVGIRKGNANLFLEVMKKKTRVVPRVKHRNQPASQPEGMEKAGRRINRYVLVSPVQPEILLGSNHAGRRDVQRMGSRYRYSKREPQSIRQAAGRVSRRFGTKRLFFLSLSATVYVRRIGERVSENRFQRWRCGHLSRTRHETDGRWEECIDTYGRRGRGSV
ncbi:uncharacterized protein K489DRAFT_102113 [Dissoconium aciculare CBS 342.82]|uniref:Uncharacterized protein n=1 Tax=Dissoconium aciculare CBS 342.82 TaxID=1314786 RepID=A0A6J3ME97_9PEZI|nr:uncharacterized protein K489DRAFT_102113 [Dissoconium aciculare CBS 342.82]KAF1825934.1 hypothetical protein K489DRAFT_102113 [Dissoconium aciculare CBS 342.82]